MTTLLQKFNEAKKATNDEHYSIVSVRTPIETASMVETAAVVTQQAVMNMFTTDLSSFLANHLLQDSRNKELIKTVLEEQFEEHDRKLHEMVEGSCIEVLEKQEAIKVSSYIDYGALFARKDNQE